MTPHLRKEYMKMKKRESRAKMNIQKKAAVKKTGTDQRRQARAIERKDNEQDKEDCVVKIKSPPSRSTIYRKSVKLNLPESPRTFAFVVKTVIIGHHQGSRLS